MGLVRRHPIRSLCSLAVVLGALAVGVLPLDPLDPQLAGARPAPRVDGDVRAYRGLGTWVDIFDTSYRHPRAAVRSMARRGVRTLYLETSNYRQRTPFVHRSKVERFLDAADAK